MKVKEAEILEALQKVQPGEAITVKGKTFTVDEIVDYVLGDFSWRNLVSHVETGKEVVLEIAEGQIRRWDEVEADIDAPTLAVEYKDEVYYRDEAGKAHTTSQSKDGGTEEAEVPYWVYEAPSGKRLSIELRDGLKLYIYFSEKKTIPAKAIRVK